MHAEPHAFAVWLFLVDAGFSLSKGAAVFVTQAVGQNRTGIVNAFDSLIRRVIGGIGAQVAAVILKSQGIAGNITPPWSGVRDRLRRVRAARRGRYRTRTQRADRCRIVAGSMGVPHRAGLHWRGFSDRDCLVTLRKAVASAQAASKSGDAVVDAIVPGLQRQHGDWG